MLNPAPPAEDFPWGRLRWLMSARIDPGAAQTFGIAEIYPGRRNPLHSHPNCEELLYVLSGSCEHVLGQERVVLQAGDLLRIPLGTPHQAIVLGDEPMRAVISFSSPDRQTILHEEP